MTADTVTAAARPANPELRDVPGWAGFYAVTADGRVWSQPRTIVRSDGRRQTFPGRWLRQSLNRYGYPTVCLARDGEKYMRKVHQLVAEAWIGPRPEGHDVCHRDGSRTNNHVPNLRYDTRAGNCADKLEHDTHQRGERNGRAKLTEDDVREIRAKYSTGDFTQAELGAAYGVSAWNIHSIIRRKNWAWLP